MSKQQRGLGKGLGALLGGDTDLSQIRQPVGYVNKEVVNIEQPQQGGTADSDELGSFTGKIKDKKLVISIINSDVTSTLTFHRT